MWAEELHSNCWKVKNIINFGLSLCFFIFLNTFLTQNSKSKPGQLFVPFSK